MTGRPHGITSSENVGLELAQLISGYSFLVVFSLSCPSCTTKMAGAQDIEMTVNSATPVASQGLYDISAPETDEQPQDAFTDTRPTKRYQALLLLSGFTMIFQVIGINSIYGVFQVRVCSPFKALFAATEAHLSLHFVGVLYLVRKQYTRCYRSRRTGFTRRHNRCWSHVGREHIRQPLDGARPRCPCNYNPWSSHHESRYIPRKFQHEGLHLYPLLLTY